MNAATISLQREELQRHILDDRTLAYVEEKYPGIVRIELCRRTRAIAALKLPGYRFPIRVYYHLPPEETGDCTLTTESRSGAKLMCEQPDLWSFARHRACEAMLALRNGHKEHARSVKRAKIPADIP
jgi:hypothetical protein